MYNNTPLPRYPDKGEKEIIRLKYKTKQYKTKKDQKIEQVSEFSTFNEAIEKNISLFEKRKQKNPKKAEEIQQEEIDYLLDSMPYIMEMYDTKKETPEAVEDTNASGNKMFQVTHVKENNTIFKKYLYNVEKVTNQETIDAVTEKETTDEIYSCSCGGDLNEVVNSTQCDMVCAKCGKTSQYVESYTFSDQNNSMAYKRSNHLIECLNALQAKEGTHVPEEVIEAVRSEFKKHRISCTSDIKPTKVKQFLKKLGYSNYYDNIYSITHAITGMPTLKLSQSLEKKFRDMFTEIQAPFEKHKPPHRKNFLSYNYVLYKFSELLGEDSLLPYFSLLKCRQNLHAQDQIWKAICGDLRWEFIRTV
jgi:hypothetical protein